MNGFIRPKISWHDWEHEPIGVAQNVVVALVTGIEPVQMTSAQQGLVFASVYRGTGLSIHGTTLFNLYFGNDDGLPDAQSLKLIPEAFQTIGAISHVRIFNAALDRWKSKPRQYGNYDHSGPQSHAAWSREVFQVVCDEFLDLDEEAFMAKPNLEKCLIDHLRKHRLEFVEIDRV